MNKGEQLKTGQPEPAEQVEVRDSLEIIREGYNKVCASLKNLEEELRKERGDAESFKLIDALYIKGAMESLEYGNKKIETAMQYSQETTNFIFMLYAGGSIHGLGRAYARIKAFYSEDTKFKQFLEDFESFVKIVNANNVRYRIPEVPQLLQPVDQGRHQVDQVEGDFVRGGYRDIPLIHQTVRRSLAGKKEGEQLIVDVHNMPLVEKKPDGQQEYLKAKIAIATPAFW